MSRWKYKFTLSLASFWLFAFLTSGAQGEISSRDGSFERLSSFERLTYFEHYATSINDGSVNSPGSTRPVRVSPDNARARPQAIGDWFGPVNYRNALANRASYGDGITIGIMDTPVDCSHPNLAINANRICESRWWAGANIVDGAPWLWDTHGSNVAGVSAGTGGYGLAPNADIASFAVFDQNGNWYQNLNQYLSTVDFLVDRNGASVINWSFGSTIGGRDVSLDSWDVAAIRRARGDALVVKAGGNAGNNVRGFQTNATRRNVLNRYLNNFLWVGALNAAGNNLAWYSATPGRECIRGRKERRCNRRNRIMNYWIVAPGSVTSTSAGGGSNNTQGTSFAAPIVAGAAALIQSRWPRLRPHQVRQILLRTATDMGRRGVDPVYGHGALNVARALRPVRGRVGGVRIRGANANVFQRIGFGADFANDVEVIDMFGRDFSAVSYASPTRTAFLASPVRLGDDFSIFMTVENVSEEETEYSINGITTGPLSYFAEVLPNSAYQQETSVIAPIVQISPVIRNLNLGNQAITYDDEDTLYFAMLAAADNEYGLDTSSIGFTRQFEPIGSLELTLTTALLSERGFHGLSSQEGFGFNTRNQSAVIELTGVQTSPFGTFEATVNHHQTVASYNSSVMSWDDLAVTQVSFGYDTPLWEGQLGFNANFMYASGDMSSSVSGLHDPNDFYHRDAGFSVSYGRQVSELVEFNISASNQNSGTFGLEYAASF
jgi:subtilisin family serine protease